MSRKAFLGMLDAIEEFKRASGNAKTSVRVWLRRESEGSSLAVRRL